MTKKILAVLLAVVLVFTCGIVAFAEDTTGEAPEKIEVKFDANNGQGTAMNPIEVVDGKITVPECTYTSEKAFNGWNTNQDGSGETYMPGDTFETAISATLYAQWIVEGYVEYTLTYDANGGEGETLDFGGPYIPNSETLTAVNEFTRKGCTFKEWNTKKDGTGTAYGEFESVVIYDADVVLYAIWVDENGNVVVDKEEEEPTVEEPTVEEPTVEEPADTNTDVTGTDVPPMGDASAMAIALAAGAVAMGALVVLKKRD